MGATVRSGVGHARAATSIFRVRQILLTRFDEVLRPHVLTFARYEIEDGWFTGEIAEAAFVYQRALEKGEKKVVGVNTLAGSVEADDKLDILRVSHQVEIDQKVELSARRSARDDDAAARAAVARMVEVGRTDQNMVPAMLDAVRAEATLGEICDALRTEWGSYTEPARF